MTVENAENLRLRDKKCGFVKGTIQKSLDKLRFEGTMVAMPSIKTLVLLLEVVLLLPCLQCSAVAQTAKPAQATQAARSSRPAPAASSPRPARVTLSSVCPDLHLYPAKGVKLGNSRPIPTEFWQQDYPVLIYEATSQKRYWLEPPVKKKAWTADPALTAIDSIFTPSTFTTEKVLIAVCGLKFGQTVTTSQINVTVPDAIVIEGAPAPAATGGENALVAPVSTDPQTLFENLPVFTEILDNKVSGSCTQFVKDYNTATRVIDTLKQKYHTILLLAASSGLLPVTDDLFSSKKMKSKIEEDGKEIKAAAEEANSSADAASYQGLSLIVQRRSERLTAVVQAYNSAVTTIEAFNQARNAVVENQNQLNKDKQIIPDPTTCGITTLESLQSALTDGKHIADGVISSIKSIQGELQTDETDIINNFSQLNAWSRKSSVSRLGILSPVTANTLLQLSFTVSDPPPLASYKVVQVSDLNNSGSGQSKPATTITINKSEADKIEISVAGASSAAAVAVTTDGNGNPSATVQIPGISSAPTSNAQPSGTPAPQPPTANLNVTAAPTGKSAVNAPAGGNTSSPTALTPNSNLMERHRWANFAISGGFLGVRFTNTTYSALTLPVTTVTTTVTTTSVPTTPPTVTISAPVVSSANYAFGTVNGPIQSTATAGITWYLFGHDTYPTTKLGKLGPFLSSYGYSRPLERFGFFIGTSVNSLGNFTLGPSFDIVPGLQLYSGVVLENRNTLGSSIIPCTAEAPVVATTSSTASQTSSGGITTTTTVTTQTTTNCANTNATVFSNTAIPSNSVLKPAWGFGIILNNALWKNFIKGS